MKTTLFLSMLLLLTRISQGQDWVRVVNGQIPANAMKAGNEANGTLLYIARVAHQGGIVVGKVSPGQTTAAFPYGGQEIGLGNYEVYVGRGSWSPISSGQSVPSNAIAAGREADGTPLYIARVPLEGGTHIGKARGTAAFIPYGGREEVISPFWVLMPNQLPTNDMVRVNRWKSPVTGDFETIPESRNTDAQLQSWGYTLKTYQYSAYKTRPKHPDAAAVYRWTMPNCAASVLYTEAETSDEWLTSRGFKNKELAFYAYKNNPGFGDFVAVRRWMNPKPQGDPCRGYTLSIAAHELTTEQLVSYGYTNDRVQFYVPQPGNPVQSGSGSTGNTAQTIRLDDINEWLCPNQRTRGDGEFDGHGPRIKTEVRLRLGDGGRSLYADITFWAQETQHDWSTAEGNWSKKVYDAPYGKRVARIVSDRASRTQFISPPGGFQFLVPGNDVAGAVNGFLDGLGGTLTNALFALHGLPPGDYARFGKLVTGKVNNGNTAVRVPAIEGTLVKFFTIVGDTGGGDISTDDNCNDDTRIVSIEFAPVRVEFATNQN